jgi:hypothetical protein
MTEYNKSGEHREYARSEANRETLRKASTRHGMTGDPLYGVHKKMMARCYKPTEFGYENYGGRGIQVFEEWHDVRVFAAWIEANIGPRPEGRTRGRSGRSYPAYTLDRISNDGNYEPGNVRWATPLEQRSNQRRTAGLITGY